MRPHLYRAYRAKDREDGEALARADAADLEARGWVRDFGTWVDAEWNCGHLLLFFGACLLIPLLIGIPLVLFMLWDHRSGVLGVTYELQEGAVAGAVPPGWIGPVPGQPVRDEPEPLEWTDSAAAEAVRAEPEPADELEAPPADETPTVPVIEAAPKRAPRGLPPLGRIWFGTSFDPQTLVLRRVAANARPGTLVALVAHLPRCVSGEVIALRIWHGRTLDSYGEYVGPVGGEFWGQIVRAPDPGRYRFELADAGGNVLAAGTLTVTVRSVRKRTS